MQSRHLPAQKRLDKRYVCKVCGKRCYAKHGTCKTCIKAAPVGLRIGVVRRTSLPRKPLSTPLKTLMKKTEEIIKTW